jgi:hypothetical protein
MCKDYLVQFEGRENNYRLRGVLWVSSLKTIKQ